MGPGPGRRKLAGVTVKCAKCGQQLDEDRTERVLAEQLPHVFKEYGYTTKSVQVCETCLTLLPEEERKARRLSAGHVQA